MGILATHFMRDGETIKKLNINGVRAEIQRIMDLNILVAYGFNDEVEKAAEEEKADVIRIREYEQRPGNTYFYKSTKLGYYRKLPPLIEDVHLKKEKRKRIRHLTEKGVEITIEKPVTDESFREWLEIYNSMIENKEKGINHANKEWLERNRKSIGLFAMLDSEMLGGTIIMVKEENGEKIASSAFKAAKEEYEKEGINDFLVYHFINWAIKNRFKTIKSGVDMNFYGHHLNAGLFLFKREWGFEPKQMNDFEWIKLMNLEKFNDTCLFISGREQPECNLVLKKEIGEEEENKFRIDGYEFKKFMIVDNSLIRRDARTPRYESASYPNSYTQQPHEDGQEYQQ